MRTGVAPAPQRQQRQDREQHHTDQGSHASAPKTRPQNRSLEGLHDAPAAAAGKHQRHVEQYSCNRN
jgi:hypothetical protein